MSINKAIIVGHLGQDPELRHMPNGDVVANLRVATSSKWKDKTTGEAKEATEWHTIVLFKRLAEVAGEYLRKGAQVYIEGSLRTRKWQDKEGKDRYSTEIVGSELQMLGKREADAPPKAAPKRAANSDAAPAGPDDDIPF